MRKIKFLEGKKPAQAMVEFAIALPILLLLLYGILETGRFIFIYSSIVTASRQAVRYGSATGEGTSIGVPRYQDCAGIRQAAQRADYLNAIDDADIHIYQDKGPTDPPTATGVDEQEICPDNNPYIWTPSAGNTSRLVVRINGDFNPIVPKIVPFIARTSANGNPVEGVSARTILVSVSIVVTVPPSTWIPPTSTPTNTPTPTPTNTPTNTPTVTPTPVFTPTPTNTPSPTVTPSPTLSPTITLTPSLTPTIVPFCANVLGALSITGKESSMELTITNPYNWPLTLGDGNVTWNHDKGSNRSDKTLKLLSATIGGTTLWVANPSPSIGPSQPWITPATIPANAVVTIDFTFDQSYDNWDGTESVLINVTTPGCNNVFIQGKRP